MKLRTLFEKILSSPKLETIFAAFTPPAVQQRAPLVRTTLAAGTIAVFGLALATATSALALMLVAVGVVYYLLTQILELQLELDPQTILRQAVQQQRPVSPPN